MAKDYDTTLTRLIGILSKLSNNERYNTKEFALEYNVGVRTIQKDINQRLISFPIEKDIDRKFKFIDGFSLNKSMLTTDEMMLVSLALSQFEDVSDFDKLTNSTLKKLLNPATFNPYFVKQDDLEDINIDSASINSLEDAIKLQNIVLIDSKQVEPYKIVNYDGIWYLFAKDIEANKIKTFMLSKIKDLEIMSKKHNVSQKQIEQVLEKTHSAWFEDGQCFEVKIKVDSVIAIYFKQKEFLQSQVILEEYDDGSLLVSFEVSHDEDIDNIIKSWLPNIEIIEPKRLRDKIIQELEDYLKKMESQ